MLRYWECALSDSNLSAVWLGIIMKATKHAIIINCYSTGKASGGNMIGGLVGRNNNDNDIAVVIQQVLSPATAMLAVLSDTRIIPIMLAAIFSM